MDKDIKARWVEALRSGRYSQARSKLYDPNTESHCCLGVLCEVLGVPRGEDSRLMPYGRCTYYIPDGVEDATQLHLADQQELVNMNDGVGNRYGHTFVEIADYIERTL